MPVLYTVIIQMYHKYEIQSEYSTCLINVPSYTYTQQKIDYL